MRGEAYPSFKDGLPRYVRLGHRAVKKKLAPFELKKPCDSCCDYSLVSKIK